MIRVLLHGTGRMAQRVAGLISESDDFKLIAVVSRTRPVHDFEAEWVASLKDCTTATDLVIDFSLPGGTLLAAEWCEHNGVALLSGTTGLEDEDQQALKKAGQQIPVMLASNLSQGVALMSVLARQAAQILGAGATITITDVHHQHKADAPSGTALTLAASIEEGRSERGPGNRYNELCFSSVREGEVAGEHTIRFESDDEVFEISHAALDRDVFASGALKAGKWLVDQQAGHYDTTDWLNLN